MNIDYKSAFRSKLDKKLVDQLSPLKDHNAVIHIPFFANTFPLAFHYFCLLTDSKTKEKQIDNQIKLISWGDEKRLVKGWKRQTPLIVYSTKEAVRDTNDVTKVHVTNFQPRLIFSEFNLRVWSALDLSEKVNGLAKKSFKDILKSFVDERAFDFYEVFTEMPEQAKTLFEQYFSDLGLKLRVDYDVIEITSAKWIFDETHLHKNTLRFFLYGAPLTSYFDRKPRRFIPFNVTLDGAEKSFETVVAIKSSSDGTREEIFKAIDDYHRLLYKESYEEVKKDQQSFRAVQYHYNRIARLLQHRSSFVSSKEYAKCLADHHQAP